MLSELSPNHFPKRLAVVLGITILPLLLLSTLFIRSTQPVEAAGVLQVNIRAGYNLVVDSNVTAVSTYAPSVATVVGEFCNTGDADLTGVQGFIGDFGAGTPGLYPARDSSTPAFQAEHPHLGPTTGSYAFTHVGGSIGLRDANRYMGTLSPGECNYQYWHFTYPQCENEVGGAVDPPPCLGTQDPVWGETRDNTDDLWLQFDIWGTSFEGVNGDATWTMTMRNEISAMANKIRPNPDGHWFNTNTSIVAPGDVITSNGILYELGNINQGFDNDGNFVPDYNAWVQPIGDPSFDPSCFRLIGTSGVITVSRSGGLPDLVIPFDDSQGLYFTDLPPENTGVRGEVFYTFMALDGPCATGLSPYQEVASGFENEKFNGDFGTGIPPTRSSAPTVAITKTGDLTATTSAPDNTIDYVIDVPNTSSTTAIGLPLLNMPIVISETIPPSTTYQAGSATFSTSYVPSTPPGADIVYSTDGGVTWVPTEPVPASDVTNIRWWLTDALPPGETATANFTVIVDAAYAPVSASSAYVENTADISLGGGTPLDEDNHITLIEGPNSVGDTVWRDDDASGTQNGSEPGIANVTVYLYLDEGITGTFGTDDVLVLTTTTDATGYYSFTNLPDGNFIVIVDQDDPDLPYGYGITTREAFFVDLDQFSNTASEVSYPDADFGFGPILSLDKTLIYRDPGYENDLISYNIKLTNNRPGDGSGEPAQCVYYVWAESVDTDHTGSGQKLWSNVPGAFGADPDGNYAFADYAQGSNNLIAGTNYNIGDPGSTITQVEAIFRIYADTVLVDDDATAELFINNLSYGTNIFTEADINVFTTSEADAGDLTWDVTSVQPWSWSDFTNPTLLDLTFETSKQASPDNGFVFLDGMGFRITTDGLCGRTEDTINPLPLVDKYDADKLEFVSAVPTQSSVATGATSPYANTGVIRWDNLGPLYAGGTDVVTVTFRALEPPDNDADGENDVTVITNTAIVTEATFISGRPIHTVSDTVVSTLRPAGTIGDTVWNDNGGPSGTGTAGDGIQNGDEQGIPGVVINLYVDSNSNGVFDAGDILTATTVTDANGMYLFEGVLDGDYVVEVDVFSSPILGFPVSQTGDPDEAGTCVTCDNQGATTINNNNGDPSDDDDLTQDFGYIIPNAIFGNVWEDNDGDGVWEIGENGFDTVAVILYDGVCDPATTCPKEFTDANGYYVFTGVPDGSYQVLVDVTSLPPGGTWSQTFDPDDPPSFDDQTTVPIMASGGNIYGAYDFGYTQSGTNQIGDTVYADWDGDATQDVGVDAGIDGVTVYLYEDANGNGSIDIDTDALIATTVTSGGGLYLFNNLPDGDFIVVVDNTTLPTGFTSPTQDPDEDPGPCTVCDHDGSATLANSDDLTLDFGYQPIGTGAIGDYVWNDANGDGNQAAYESGIPNVTVELYADINGDGTYVLISTTTTNADGLYLFEGLPPSNYRVIVDTTDPDMPSDAFGEPYINTTPTQVDVTLALNETYLDADFGFTPPGIIGDTIFWDANRNGQEDLEENGIANVTVNLYQDTNGNGVYDSGVDTLVDTQVTDANGEYLFTGLISDTYIVVVDTTDPELLGSALLSDPNSDGVPCDDPLAFGCDSILVVELPLESNTFLGADFGYDPLGVVGDYVWYDTNDDGIQDPTEVGVPGVVVTITNGTETYTTTTDFDGGYTFDNLPDGTWTVTFGIPSGTVVTSGPESVGNTSTTVIITGGVVTSIGGTPCTDCDLDVDLGIRSNGTLSLTGTVCMDDVSDDGTCSGAVGESTLDSIFVNLYNDDGDFIGTTTTDANGNYTFTNLVSDIYYVAIGTGTSPLNETRPTTDSGDTLATGVTAVATTTTSIYQTVDVSVSRTNVDFGFEPLNPLDYGDLPAIYDITELGDEGARHIVGSLFLGASVDTEQDGLTNPAALGDDSDGTDDEDGIVPATTSWSPTAGGALTVTVSGGNGYLAGWIDLNNDGDFDDPGEFVLNLVPVTSGVQTVTFPIPDPAVISDSYPSGFSTVVHARFRLYDTNSIDANLQGLINNGEVEDYQWILDGIEEEPELTPVTLAYFLAKQEGDVVHFEWETATEVGNVGFNLYVETRNGWQRLNSQLIPSHAVDSAKPQSYSFVAKGVSGTRFRIDDVDIRAKAEQHGPFLLNVASGTRVSAEPINWTAIQTEQTALGISYVANNTVAAQYQIDRVRSSLLRVTKDSRAAVLTSGSLLAFQVDEDGLYRVSHEDLLAVGLDLRGVAVDSIAITNGETSVPVYIGGPRLFGANSYIEFYGEAVDTLYTTTNVYQLALDASLAERVAIDTMAPARRVEPVAYYMETEVVDRNLQYGFYAPNGDPWYETSILAFTSPVAKQFTIHTDNYVSGVAPATLEVGLWGVTGWEQELDHHAVLSFNGEEVADVRFDGLVDQPISVELPNGALRSANNQLIVTLPGDTGVDYDLVNIDRYQVTYPRSFVAREGALTFTASGSVFEVTGLDSRDVVVYRMTDRGMARIRNDVRFADGTYTVRFAGSEEMATYVVASGDALRTPTIEAVPAGGDLTGTAVDYLIIAHPSFVDGIEPLAQYHRTNGLNVKVVNVDDVYYQFGNGTFDPQAIKDYITYAEDTMGIQYVLLVGGDTYDYRDYLGKGTVSFIPSLYAATSEFVQFAPADPLFVDVDNNNVPDLALGRFPVRSVEELNIVVNKTLLYATKDYGRTGLFVADAADGDTSFTDISDGFISQLPARWRIQEAYIDTMGVADARTELINTINGGVGLVSFVGHSGPTRWTYAGLFDSNDALALSNDARPTVVTQWGCWNTYYVSPDYNSMGHKFMLSGNQGAAAVLGASTLTSARSEQMLGELFMPQVVQSGMPIGMAVQQAKADLAVTNPELTDVILGWTLLGDPALVVEP